MFVIVENTSVILGPMQWRQKFFENTLLDDLEIQVSLPLKHDGVYVINDNVKILPCVLTYDEINPNIQFHNGPFWTFTDTLATGNYVANDKSVESVKYDLIQIAANDRYEKEIGKLAYSLNNVEYTLDTTREGRNIYLQALQMGAVTTWKFPEGWVDLSLVDLQNIVTLIFNHIQTCFAEENLKISEINSKVSLAELNELFPVPSTPEGLNVL